MKWLKKWWREIFHSTEIEDLKLQNGHLKYQVKAQTEHIARQEAALQAIGPRHNLFLAQEKVRRQREQITEMQDALRKKNLALDAFHYVWCDGGCNSGIHRFGEHPPLTEEIVQMAERNTRRLRTWFTNNKWKQKFHGGKILVQTNSISLAPDELVYINGRPYRAKFKWHGNSAIVSLIEDKSAVSQNESITTPIL